MHRRIARSLYFLAAALAVFPAFAQSTPYQGGPWTPGHFPQYTGRGSSNAVIMDGGGSGGGGLGINPNEFGVTSYSPTGSYPVASSGNGPNGEHGCLYDAPTTNPTGYHYLCLDPNAAGGGLLSYGASGTAAPLPLYFDINGVTTVAGGTSTLIAVGSTFVTSGTSGQLLYDKAGVLGGLTVSGDATLNTSTGALTISSGAVTSSKMATGAAQGNLGAFTGDVTTSAGSLATTLATVNSNVGSFGSASSSPNFTVDGKGRITAAGASPIAAPLSVVTGLGTGVSSALANATNAQGGMLTYGSALPITTPLTNVSGSNFTSVANVSCVSGSPNVTLYSAGDFANGQGIRLDGCGATFGLGAPTGLSITPTGTRGSTTYTYTIAPIDAAGGVGPAIATVSTTTGNATLSATNYNALAWTAPSGTAPNAYAVYETAPVAQLVGITNFVASFKDFGLGGVYVPDWLSPTPPASATNDWLLTTISAGGGTTSITVANNAGQTTSTAVAAHDDTVALQTALTASAYSVLSLPCGKYMLTNNLIETDLGTYYIRGQGNCTQFWFVDSQGLSGVSFLPASGNGNVGPTAAIEQVWFRKLGAAGGIAARFGNEGVLFRNNTVQGRWANGVYLTTSYAPTIDFNGFVGGISGNVIDCTADTSCNNARIWRNGILGNGWAGAGSAVAFGAGQGWSLIGDEFENNYNNLSFSNTYDGTVIGSDFETAVNQPLAFSGLNGNLLFQGVTFAGNAAMTLSGSTLVNSQFNNILSSNNVIAQGTALTVTGVNNISMGTGGISLPAFSSYTIANLPPCSAATNLAKAYVTNGVVSPTFLGAVSTPGPALQSVGCNGGAWGYGG
jgi:hypothetical protein